MTEDTPVEIDLTSALDGTKMWWVLKTLITDSVMAMTEGREKTKMLEFMARHWSGHAPREIEFDALTTRFTRLRRKYDALKAIPESRRVRRVRLEPCSNCGASWLATNNSAMCTNCGVEDK